MMVVGGAAGEVRSGQARAFDELALSGSPLF